MEDYVKVTGRSMSGKLILPKEMAENVRIEPKDYHKKKWLRCSRCGCKLFKAYYCEGVLTLICEKCGLDVVSE